MAQPADPAHIVDVFTRYQLYLEQLKVGYFSEFETTLDQMQRDMRKVIADNDATQLDTLSRREFNALVAALLAVLDQHFTAQLRSILRDLLLFVRTDVQMQGKILRALSGAEHPEPNPDRVWATAAAGVVPALGVSISVALKQWQQSVAYAVKVRTGSVYADSVDGATIVRVLFGSSRLRYRDGLINRTAIRSRGLVNTIVQYVAAVVHDAVAPDYTERYQWVAVLDRRTSPVCRARHGNVYEYGNGPLPPAHPNCRSAAVPVFDDGLYDADETFAAWFDRQPAAFRADLGRAPTTNLANNTKLTLDQFAAKLPLILL